MSHEGKMFRGKLYAERGIDLEKDHKSVIDDYNYYLKNSDKEIINKVIDEVIDEEEEVKEDKKKIKRREVNK